MMLLAWEAWIEIFATTLPDLENKFFCVLASRTLQINYD